MIECHGRKTKKRMNTKGREDGDCSSSVTRMEMERPPFTIIMFEREDDRRGKEGETNKVFKR